MGDDRSRFCGKIVQRVSEQASRVSVPTDRRLVPSDRLQAEICRDQAISAEAFVNVMFRQNCAAEILEHREATLMGQRVSADVMAVCRENSEADGVVAKQGLARPDDLSFRPLCIAMKNIQLRDSVLAQ